MHIVDDEAQFRAFILSGLTQ